MSLRAILWALEDAPVIDPTRKLVLIALADGAGDDGCGAMPGVALMARRSCVDPKTVRRHLQAMEADGLICRGDQTKAEKYRSDRRPIVWDLDLSQVRESDAPTNRAVPTRAPRNPRNQHGPIERGDIMSPGSGRTDGGTSDDIRGDIRGDIHVLQTKEDPKEEPTTKTPTSAALPPTGLFEVESAPITKIPTPNQRAQKIADAIYALTGKISNWHNLRGLALKAITADFSDDEILSAFQRLIAESRPIGAESLRSTLVSPTRGSGYQPYRNPTDPSAYDGPLEVSR